MSINSTSAAETTSQVVIHPFGSAPEVVPKNFTLVEEVAGLDNEILERFQHHNVILVRSAAIAGRPGHHLVGVFSLRKERHQPVSMTFTPFSLKQPEVGEAIVVLRQENGYWVPVGSDGCFDRDEEGILGFEDWSLKQLLDMDAIWTPSKALAQPQ